LYILGNLELLQAFLYKPLNQEIDMTRPETPYEAASYDLNKFRERRVTDRRMTPRATVDRRLPPNGNGVGGGEARQNVDPNMRTN
jgi:hypothetical protein